MRNPLHVVPLCALFLSTSAFADPVCHRTGADRYRQIDVGAPAVTAHLVHGDVLPVILFADGDGDGLGDALTSIESCTPIPGYVLDASDLDDTVPFVEDLCPDVTGTWTASWVDGDGAHAQPNNLSGTTCSFVHDAFVAEGDGHTFTTTILGPFGSATCDGVIESTDRIVVTCADMGVTYTLAR